jgi:hypothetical protein
MQPWVYPRNDYINIELLEVENRVGGYQRLGGSVRKVSVKR